MKNRSKHTDRQRQRQADRQIVEQTDMKRQTKIDSEE